MPRFIPEQKHEPGTISRTAVLLVNLGTPGAPTPRAVRRYLAQFLSDPRVIEIPRALWWPILHAIVLNTRPRQSAQKYARIWTGEGSPLMVHTRRLASRLRGHVDQQMRTPPIVDFAMRYGDPSIQDALSRLKSESCERILILPLYPQYASSTTGSALDEVAQFVRRSRNVPEIRIVKTFHDHPAYIGALASLVREHWRDRGQPDKLLMSFHGLPRYTIERGDPYHSECRKTAWLLAGELQLADGRWEIAFQSRFGRLDWLEPYTAPTLAGYGRKAMRRVDVICPGFASDCLETLEEIGIEGRETFLAAGGKEFCLLPCLNERDDWVRALAAICHAHLENWIGDSRDTQAEGSRRIAQDRSARA
jgi:ferrochelatase